MFFFLRNRRLILFGVLFSLVFLLGSSRIAYAFDSGNIDDNVKYLSYYEALTGDGGEDCIGNEMRSIITRGVGVSGQNAAPDDGTKAGNEGPTWFGTKKEVYVWPRSQTTCAGAMKELIDLKMSGGTKYGDFLKLMNGQFWQGAGTTDPTWVILNATYPAGQQASLDIAKKDGHAAGRDARRARFESAISSLGGKPSFSDPMKYYAYFSSLNNSKICTTRVVPDSQRNEYKAYINKSSGVKSGDKTLYYYEIPVIKSDGNETPTLYEISEGRNPMWSGYAEGSVACSDMAAQLRTNTLKSSWKNWIKNHPSDSSKITSPAPQEQSVLDETGSESTDSDGQDTCNIDAIGWIVCPVVNFLAGVSDTVKSQLDKYMIFNSTMLAQDQPAYKYWAVIRDYANILFIVIFLVVIYSQLTGAGISNYGIKTMLPKMVVGIILINLSFYICAALIDVSNIIGAGAFNFISSAGNLNDNGTGDWSSQGNTFTAIASAVLVGGPTLFFALGTLIASLVSILLIVITTVILLGARQAIIILAVIIAPLAFTARILPNTENLFNKWWSIFKTMLVLYPIIGLLYGASRLAGDMLGNQYKGTDGDSIGMQIVAATLSFLPLILVPQLVKKTMEIGGISQIAGRLQNRASDRLGGAVKNRINNGSYGQFRAHRANQAKIRNAQIRGGTYQGRGGNFNPRNLRTAAATRFNNSRLSGSFGDRQAMQGAYALSQEDKEAMDMSTAAIRSEHRTSTELGDIATYGYIAKRDNEGRLMTGDGGKAIRAEGSKQYSVHQRRAAMRELAPIMTGAQANALAVASAGFKDEAGMSSSDAHDLQSEASSAIAQTGAKKSPALAGASLGEIKDGNFDMDKSVNRYLNGKVSGSSLAGADASSIEQYVNHAQNPGNEYSSDQVNKLLSARQAIDSSPQLSGSVSANARNELNKLGSSTATPPPQSTEFSRQQLKNMGQENVTIAVAKRGGMSSMSDGDVIAIRNSYGGTDLGSSARDEAIKRGLLTPQKNTSGDTRGTVR